MEAKLAILAALVACASYAAEARQNTTKRTMHAVYERSALSNVDPEFFNTDNTYFFIDRESMGLTFNVEVLRSLTGVTVDVQVLGKDTRNRWLIIYSKRDAELNTDNTPGIVTAYGVLLGLQNSQPAIISQNSQPSENFADQSGRTSIVQSSKADIEMARSGEVAPAIKGQSSAYQGIISLKNFRPKSSQISRLIGTGMQFVQYTFKWGTRKIITAEIIVKLWSA